MNPQKAYDILGAWLSIEVLTPQQMPKASELAAMKRHMILLSDEQNPWQLPKYRRTGREKAVYWMCYLGEIDQGDATREILEHFPDVHFEEKAKDFKTTSIAVILLDQNGIFIEGKTFISSFAWGYGQIMENSIGKLADFNTDCIDITKSIETHLSTLDKEGNPKPFDSNTCADLIGWIGDLLHLPHNAIRKNAYAIRTPSYTSFEEAPEPEILNSFYIDDLSHLQKECLKSTLGHALSLYLGGESKKSKCDTQSQSVLDDILSPGIIPESKWPTNGNFSLNLMQQVAINHIFEELQENGLVGINGPPGTGKTTLLRDVVAGIILTRAKCLSKFTDPEDAFSHQGTTRLGRAFVHLYEINNSLLGHEIVVASSNNKAVENISKELPSLDAINAEYLNDLQYFSPISDNIAANPNTQKPPKTTWGLIAAVLGNKSNRYQFKQKFWWDEKYSIKDYLAVINGRYDGPLPAIAQFEAPPQNHGEALRRWGTARARFKKALANVQNIIKTLQGAREACLQLPGIQKRLIVTQDAAVRAIASENMAQIALEKSNHEYSLSQSQLEKTRETYQLFEKDRPALLFIHRLFKTRRWAEYHVGHKKLQASVIQAQEAYSNASQLLKYRNAQYSAAQNTARAAQAEQKKLFCLLNNTNKNISKGKEISGKHFIDTAFWEMDEDSIQKTSPWLCERLQSARDQLFIESIKLHKAFIDAAAKPLRHNLMLAMELICGNGINPKYNALRPSFWASFFLVVPVVSTTFASFARMFPGMGRESLGWLLIDEAGQATPQAAAGAIWRARRAVVIGDPLQIEPVVPIPSTLIEGIFTEHKVDADLWSAPTVSAQHLADRASWLGTNIRVDDITKTWVGSPLRVHRRCEEPMFSISNNVAYNGLMVYATGCHESCIGNILGESRWFDVSSPSNGKWSPQEGRLAAQFLDKILTNGFNSPDIFFITPFRAVKFNLLNMFRSDLLFAGHRGTEFRKWTESHIGTVHTFQGKEAEAVVLVLGASGADSSGARAWAGSTPNLINVAVTRSKQRLYVIGCRTNWKNQGAIRYLANSLPVEPWPEN